MTISEFGLSKINFNPIGKVFSSDMKQALTELGNANDFDWTIQDNKLVIAKRGKGRKTAIHVISAKTGMIGTPEWVNNGADAQKNTTKTGQTFKINALCIPSLKPADRIIIKSESLEGRIGNYVFKKDKKEYESEFISSNTVLH